MLSRAAAALISILVASSAYGWQSQPASAPTTQSRPAGSPRWEFLRQLDGFDDPRDVAVAADGTIWVLESTPARVRVVSQTGERRAVWGAFGDEPGQLAFPLGLTLAANGAVFVADTGNHRVSEFTADGKHVRSFGRRGNGPGDFDTPAALAVGRDRLYVADAGNARVQVLALDGAPMAELGGFGFEADRMVRPAALALTPDGRLFVGDGALGRVQVFPPTGGAPQTWGEHGFVPGLLAQPSGLVVRGDDVFIADARNHRVQVFSPRGTLRYQWGLHAITPRQGEGHLHYPDRLALSADGRLAVVCESYENRLQLFELRTDAPTKPTLPPLPLGESGHYGPTIRTSGKLMLLTEPDSSSVTFHDVSRETPILINQFGAFGRGPGQFIDVAAVAVNLTRREALVADGGNRRIQRLQLNYDPAGELKFLPDMTRFASAIDLASLTERAGASQPLRTIRPAALSLSDDGHVWLLDAANARLLQFDADWSFRRSAGEYGAGRGQMLAPTDFAISADGATMFVVDELRAKVLAFDSMSGELRTEWGSRGAERGQWLRPYGVACHPSGDVYVTDAGTSRVLHFDARGELRNEWGRVGLGPGELFLPQGLAFDAQDRLIVIDYRNHRGMIFSPKGEFVRAFGSRWYVQPTRTRRP